MKNYIFIFLLTVSCLFLACQEGNTTLSSQAFFFDLKAFFKQEASELKNIKQIKKSTFFDGVEEEKIIDAPNFEKEFALFISSDINKNAWIDKYKIDSLLEKGNQVSQVSYTALDEKLKTKRLDIFYQKEKVTRIKILNKNENTISNSEQRLEYISGIGYNVENKQLVSFSPEHDLKIVVEYLE